MRMHGFLRMGPRLSWLQRGMNALLTNAAAAAT
jgi:hypothetical protein